MIILCTATVGDEHILHILPSAVAAPSHLKNFESRTRRDCFELQAKVQVRRRWGEQPLLMRSAGSTHRRVALSLCFSHKPFGKPVPSDLSSASFALSQRAAYIALQLTFQVGTATFK